MTERADHVASWLPAAQAGSRDALAQALEACRGYLLVIAERELGPDLRPKAGASDLVQEALLEAQRDFASFNGSSESDLLAWLRRLLLNNLANFARHYRGTDKRQVAREVGLGRGRSPAEKGSNLPSLLPSPSGAAMAQELAEAVRRAIDRLPPVQRQVVLLRYQEERTFEEIGQVLNRTANAVRKAWLRAIERLEEELRELP